MSGVLQMNNLNINGEVFIPIDDARDYLADKLAVYELKILYFHYIGFAYYYRELDEPMGCLDEAIFYADRERVYVDGVIEIHASYFWQSLPDVADSVYTQNFHLHTGKVNGKDLFIEPGSYFAGQSILLSNSIVYAKQSNLDALAKQYGIPKNIENCDDFNDKQEVNAPKTDAEPPPPEEVLKVKDKMSIPEQRTKAIRKYIKDNPDFPGAVTHIEAWEQLIQVNKDLFRPSSQSLIKSTFKGVEFKRGRPPLKIRETEPKRSDDF